MQFLTKVDPNAKVKGSRDPLGTLSVWAGFGRRVVGNLTTQTTSMDDFRVLLIGAWLTQGDENPTYGFLAWEQLCGYARQQGGIGGFRGITRVQKNLTDTTIPISGRRTAQILNNQAMYGIWGLYRAAAWRGGLLNRDAPTVPPESAALVEEIYLPRLAKAWGPGAHQLRVWLRGDQVLKPNSADHQAKLAAILSCISGGLVRRERELYQATLTEGGCLPLVAGTVGQRQRELAELILKLPASSFPRGDLTLRDVLQLTDKATPDLQESLRWIVACEALVVSATTIFSLVSRRDGEDLDGTVAVLEEHFTSLGSLVSPEHRARLQAASAAEPQLLQTFTDEDGMGADRWLQIAEALEHKHFERLIRLLLTQNTLVSQDRGGARGWVSVGQNNRLQVAQVDKSWDALPDAQELPQLWRNPYFAPQLRAMALATRSA